MNNEWFFKDFGLCEGSIIGGEEGAMLDTGSIIL